jgi:hypothetical protein
MRRLLVIARSILLGWAALLAATYLVARPLLIWTVPLLGASWLPTEQLTLECVALGVAGWTIGRWNRFDAIPAVLVFSAMLAVQNFGLEPAMNLPWLFRLVIDSFRNVRYLESLISEAATHALLFGSLIAGALLGRPSAKPVSLTGGGLR